MNKKVYIKLIFFIINDFLMSFLYLKKKKPLVVETRNNPVICAFSAV